MPDIANLAGPQDLISKAKRSKGITIRRNGGRVFIPEMTDKTRQTKEVTRQKILNKEIKRTQVLTSEMNACQALVKPDCSKYNVAKARGMQQALGDILDSTTGKPDDLVQSLGLILTRQISLSKLNCNTGYYGICWCQIQKQIGEHRIIFIHMFVLSSCWPRDSNGNFMNAVSVVLQKPHRMVDIYNITSIIRLLEHNESNSRDGLKISLRLCLGGN